MEERLRINTDQWQRESRKVTKFYVSCIWDNNCDAIITGAWSEEEESKLISAIRQLSGDVPLSEDAPLPPDVTWSQVAELVESRNAPQCRSKWYFDLGWRNGGGLRAWDSRDDVRLIQLLSSQSATDEDEVEWAELSSDWDSARSPYHLRNKWACLRRSVPSYHKKTFQGTQNW